MVKNISVRKLRANLGNVLNDVRTRLDRYVISNRGEPEAVLMCVDDYEGWLETLELVSSKDVMNDIRKARKELSEGRSYGFREVFGDKKASKKPRR
ncbi:MAG: type II toxin-antitoxin system Phd/YefM family antitoxin [Candidatus Omnitrophota bacterium]